MAENLKYLITGSNGMLGRSWVNLLTKRGIAFDALDRSKLDLSKPDTLAETIGDDYHTVVNCAAWTAVDAAESQEEAATLVNAKAVEVIAEHCEAVDTFLITYSTDYVFNGQAVTPYRIDHPRQPLSAYGRSKAKGEEALLATGVEHLLIRTSWVYAPWGKNFVRTIAKAALTRPELKVVSDQRGRPTSAEHLARTSLALLEKGASGTFHVTDGGECSWFDFAAEIVRLTGAASKVNACTSDEYPTPTKRPPYSVLDLSETEALLGAMPDWQHNLADVIKRLEPLV
jgi:dTDP-4-dehydrorhamnose reductase